MVEVVYIVCPMCGMNRVLEKKASSALARSMDVSEVKGRIRFDHVDLENGIIVQVRERVEGKEQVSRRGRGGGMGFPLKRGMTLEQMIAQPKYRDLIDQIRESAQKIIDKLEESL